jgi:hypothetical protein
MVTFSPSEGLSRPEEAAMEKVLEFRQRATECRVSAAKASTTELQGHFQEMAAIWDKLADERLTFFVKHSRPDGGGHTAKHSSSSH